jgi:hypothetical protein
VALMDRTAALFAWLNQVKADTSLPASAFKVAYELGQFINRAAFEKDAVLAAWPSLETISAGIVMSERTARDMVARLQSRGHLHIKVGHGPGHPSRYTFLMQNRPETGSQLPHSEEQNRQPTAALAETETGSQLPHSEEQNRQSSVLKPAVQRPETGSRLPTNHCRTIEEPFSCRVAKKSTPTKREYSEDFEKNFWKPYPRTPIMSKKEAFREWSKLSIDRRQASCSSLDAYKRHLSQTPNLQAVHACRFLSQNRAEGILELAEKPKFDIRSSIL